MGVAGVVIGALCVFAIDVLRSSPHDQQVEVAELVALRGAILELTNHIDELCLSLPSPESPQVSPPAATNQREAVTTPQQADFLAGLGKTTSALEVLCGILKDSPALHPGADSGMDAALPKPADWSALEATLERPQVERDLTHLNWSVKDVLAKYGMPTQMGPSPGGVGFKLYYERADGRRIIFWFVDGQLASVIDA